MKLRTFGLLLALILMFSGMQAASITGYVSDIRGGMPLAGANLILQGTEKGAATDQNGAYIIYDVPEGEQELVVTYIGYQEQSQKITVQSGVQTVNFQLESGIVQGEEVLVLGDRLRGQAVALNMQKMNDKITNIVAADQIGRFPDANIGDALKRIPAIHVDYDQGEARFVNIRGTESRLNSVMVNGDRLPSAEAEIRAVQVDLIPADMVQTIEVSKAITADMDADAIGGAINLVTRSSPRGQRLSATMGSGYNLLSERPIWNGNLIYGNRFMNNKIGFVLSASIHDHHLGSHNSEGEWGFDDNNQPIAEEWDIRRYVIRRMRQSFSASMDYAFNPSHKIAFSLLTNHRNDWENRYRVTIDMGDGIEETTVERELKAGSADNDYARLEDQRMQSYSLKGEHNFGKIDLNWSASVLKLLKKDRMSAISSGQWKKFHSQTIIPTHATPISIR